MENARAEGIVRSGGTRLICGSGEIHDCDVNALMEDDILRLAGASTAETPDTLRREQRWQLIGKCVVAPSAVRQKQIQATLPIGRAS